MKYHVHVYRVTGLIEMDIEAESEQEARAKALEPPDGAYFEEKNPGCNFIAITPKKKG